jgi:hypothetical protein
MAKVYLSPSDQRGNTYAYGNTNEAIQCGFIAAACRKALERSGVEVMVGQYDTMANRCKASDGFGADVHVPIHTNAYNGIVMGTRIFAYNTTGKGWQYAQEVFKVLAPLTPGTSENVKAAPQLFEVATPAAPTVYVECEFHDSAEGSKWIIEHTEEIGEAIAEGLCNALGIPFVSADGVVDSDCVSMSDYLALKEQYNTLQASADAFRTRVMNALEIFDNGKGG